MKLKPKETEKTFGKDINVFEQLPAKTKELAALKDEMERTTGPRNVALNERIRAKAK